MSKTKKRIWLTYKVLKRDYENRAIGELVFCFFLNTLQGIRLMSHALLRVSDTFYRGHQYFRKKRRLEFPQFMQTWSWNQNTAGLWISITNYGWVWENGFKNVINGGMCRVGTSPKQSSFGKLTSHSANQKSSCKKYRSLVRHFLNRRCKCF